jgi:hypothetical protein
MDHESSGFPARRQRTETRPPAGVVIAAEGLSTMSGLLLCVDERKWDSVGRPSARGLGLIFASLHEHLSQGLEDLGLNLPV